MRYMYLARARESKFMCEILKLRRPAQLFTWLLANYHAERIVSHVNRDVRRFESPHGKIYVDEKRNAGDVKGVKL
jgi:hypothetical protein